MRRIKVELLQPGDVVLTADSGKTSNLVRRASKGAVSHALICVQHGSIIDSSDYGVHAHNIQRELYDADAEVLVLRLRDRPSEACIATVVDFARSEIGTRYSKAEAIRPVLGVRKPRTPQEFCSRLVARAYASAGISLVADPDYCAPEGLRLSPLLIQLDDMTEEVLEAEVQAWAARPNPLADMQESQNAVLKAARRLDRSIENFNDLDQMVHDRPEWDAEIARAYRESGHLDLWRSDFVINPWHYDAEEMEAITSAATLEELRSYCVSTIGEFHSGGLRFAVNLIHYRERCRTAWRETTAQLVMLYEQLVQNDAQRRATALDWLGRYFPQDIEHHLERITPHSDLWFSMVDRVEPKLGQLARLLIERIGCPEICSACGDPANDYALVNNAEMMPGVPSLRLCPDCVAIRRGGGEILEPLDAWPRQGANERTNQTT
jgi:permuted papain-like amidase YaeF/Yiix C92 family enzyme